MQTGDKQKKDGDGHSTGRRDASLPMRACDQPVLTSRAYLDVTYKQTKGGLTPYPLRLAQWLLENIYRDPGRLLDIGCGTGDHLVAFSKLGFAVVGMDISPRAKELMPDFDVRIVDLQGEPLPFPEASFDCVFSKSVIEHMRKPECLLEHAFRALRPGGTAVIMTPSWVHNCWGPFYVDHTHVTPFTVASLSSAMVIIGFVSVRTSYFYQLPFLWRYPALKPVVRALAALPLPYRPFHPGTRWPDGFNKLIRFSKEVMLLGVGKKPVADS